MNSITFAITIPPRSLSPNARGHWRTKQNAKVLARADGYLHAKEHMGLKNLNCPWPRVRFSMIWYAKQKNWVPDSDNAIGAMKYYIDGVRQAGLFVDDKHMEIGSIKREVDADTPHVLLHFEEIP